MSWQELVVSYKGEASKFFAALDTDDDGLITVREWDELLSKMRQGLGEMKSLQFILGMEEAEQRQSIDALAGAAVRTANSEAGSALAEAERLAAERENALRAELVGQMNQELEKQRAEASKQRSLMAARLVAAKLRGAAALSSEVAAQEQEAQRVNEDTQRILMQAEAERDAELQRANKQCAEQVTALSGDVAKLKVQLGNAQGAQSADAAAAAKQLADVELKAVERENALREQLAAQTNEELQRQQENTEIARKLLTSRLVTAKLQGAAALTAEVTKHEAEVKQRNEQADRALAQATAKREADLMAANAQREHEVQTITANHHTAMTELQSSLADTDKESAAALIAAQERLDKAFVEAERLAAERENALRAELVGQMNQELEKQRAEASKHNLLMAARLVAAKLRGAVALSNEVAAHEKQVHSINEEARKAMDKANADRAAEAARASEQSGLGLQTSQELEGTQAQLAALQSELDEMVTQRSNALFHSLDSSGDGTLDKQVPFGVLMLA